MNKNQETKSTAADARHSSPTSGSAGPVERLKAALAMIPKMPHPPMGYSVQQPLTGEDNLHIWRPGGEYVASIYIEDIGKIEGSAFRTEEAWEIVRAKAEEQIDLHNA